MKTTKCRRRLIELSTRSDILTLAVISHSSLFGAHCMTPLLMRNRVWLSMASPAANYIHWLHSCTDIMSSVCEYLPRGESPQSSHLPSDLAWAIGAAIVEEAICHLWRAQHSAKHNISIDIGITSNVTERVTAHKANLRRIEQSNLHIHCSSIESNALRRLLVSSRCEWNATCECSSFLHLEQY